jgi:hypothetical protein
MRSELSLRGSRVRAGEVVVDARPEGRRWMLEIVAWLQMGHVVADAGDAFHLLAGPRASGDRRVEIHGCLDLFGAEQGQPSFPEHLDDALFFRRPVFTEIGDHVGA